MKKTRKRYLQFALHRNGAEITEKQFSSAIWSSLLSLYGEICTADSKFYLNSYDTKKGTGILQCNATALEKVIASAVMISSIGNTRVSFEPKKTSGTIRGLG
ncbi:MAG: Rpp14/Pop5 family protein [Candidatus Thorarchaeota archaeon]